jgi:2-amino-4-hydroxy-6-hydroxymethyldihydropteridine diphosphokinase
MIKGKVMGNTCYLQLGSNEGDCLSLLQRAEELIQQHVGEVVKKSSYYKSEPWGNSTLNWFLNSVIEVKTELYPFQLLQATQRIEKMLGRKNKGGQYENRTIDIDILFYNKFIVRSSDLTIPHHKIPQRKFVLLPIVEIAPQYIHAVLNLDVTYLLDNCEDSLEVMRLD